MMFSIHHCWNRTSQGRSGWMRARRKWTPATKTENIKWKQFGTARSMQKSQNQVTYQASTIWCLEKGIQKKKIPGSQPQRSSTLENLSTHSTKTILTSQQQLFFLLTLHHRWLDQQPSPPSFPSGNKDDQQDVLKSAPRRARKHARQSDKKEATRRNLSQFGFLKS